jgi:glutaminyl-peptide cyclotransferase
MMKSLEWDVEEDTFTDNTPHGNRKFTNIIATLNPNACKRIIFSCHYESKINREGTFVGATDSAVPCAINIHLAQLLDKYLKQQRDNVNSYLLLKAYFEPKNYLFSLNSQTSLCN